MVIALRDSRPRAVGSVREGPCPDCWLHGLGCPALSSPTHIPGASLARAVFRPSALVRHAQPSRPPLLCLQAEREDAPAPVNPNSAHLFRALLETAHKTPRTMWGARANDVS